MSLVAGSASLFVGAQWTWKLIENQFSTRVLKSEHTMNVTAVFWKTECNGIILTHPMPDLSVVRKRNLYFKGNRNIEGDAK